MDLRQTSTSDLDTSTVSQSPPPFDLCGLNYLRDSDLRFPLALALHSTGHKRRRNKVLKITTIQSEGARKLILEGQLIEPWVTEFKKVWQEASQSPNGQCLIVDLEEVTVISSQAETVLLEIRRAGAQFVGGGILNRHLVKQIDRKCRR